MHTGDLATMDAEGYVNIVGRIKDLIIRGGENVYPREIEELLHTYPGISDVQVICVPDVKYGGRLQPGSNSSPASRLPQKKYKGFVGARLLTIKSRVMFSSWRVFPMTVTARLRNT